ncbi:acyltransferase family protein [Sphaerochaeta pleomorpha str. Grapes]|uniref:Acyltransferase family protein n=1 Tax=Sphaerochaeta pleomorpha (strain ATCC BAA-1885 / DSM 22778 / Grapes) TaxID=158190 RepID=G8QWF6_SPHPG|nr:acyltransferase [Sphaerochaeta pleomorpha]AEV29454.1 acyltransferase family protein [Sphaerochaeta pleomorpha str. Grapes]
MNCEKVGVFTLSSCIIALFFSFFYDKKYLHGKYFDYKAMGWVWAWKSLSARSIVENYKVPWPVNPKSIVTGYQNITFDIDSIHIFQTPGCYWQARDGKITIGKNCFVAPNVGIITTNHDINDPSKHITGKDIIILDNCWIGMNAVVLPGVVLGEHTVVAAGAIVTKSFPEGHCVVAGVPAVKIKDIPKVLS